MAAKDLITLARARSKLAERGSTRQPWDYPVAAAIPHYETPETLPVLLDLLRLQTVRPYILLIDNGSSWKTVKELERLRAADCEVHYLRARAYRHSSDPVTTAMDTAFALCRSEYLFCTHSDVFPRRRDLLEWLLSLCRPDQPVVGYEMSPRPPTNRWRNVVSHTCTMLHMPTMRAHGITWSFERYWEAGEAFQVCNGFPDTEQPFDRCLRKAGLYPYLIGHEDNFRRMIDDNIDHARSATGLRMHARGSELAAQGVSSLHWALQAARERVKKWRKEVADGR